MDSQSAMTTVKVIAMVIISGWAAGKFDPFTGLAVFAGLWVLAPYAPAVIYTNPGEDVDE